MIACPRCGQENPDGFRLCGMCGTALAEAAPPRELRKTVTAVFADVTGSTALGERLDPEALRRVMASYFDVLRSVLERHGGTVEKFIGDAVVAVFGIPVVHEDDALRAVRAVAEIGDELDALNARLRDDLGVALEVRIGVNTGEVVAGDPAQGQSFATGDAVNVAARLEQAAAPGEALLGESTYRLVRDAVDAAPRASIDAKGKSEAVRAYRLLAVTPDAPGRLRRGDAPMVGRATELRRLRAAFDQAQADRTCQLFTLLGAAGVGKSRLAHEFLEAMEGEIEVLSGRCLPYGEGITFWPLAEVLKQAAGLDDSEPPDQAVSRLAQLARGADDADALAMQTAGLLGIGEAEASTEEAFWAVRRLFEATARRRPLVLVFDDVHWAEPTFLDFVEHLADWSRDAPMLVLCMGRPELLDARPGWGGGKLNATSVLLEPLSHEECELLTDGLLGAAGLERAARARIADAADGNPLFVEELVTMLLEEGLLERQNGGWRATRDVGSLGVPPTVTALLAARLDRLAGTEREVLEVAAVEGKVFHVGAVTALAPEQLQPQVRGELLKLVRKELVRPDESSFIGEDAFRFRHLLVRDVAYDALAKERRAALHERFAAWLEAKAGERLPEYEEIVGYHLEQAYRYRVEVGRVDERAAALARNAAERLYAGGRRANARSDATAGVNLLSRAAALTPKGSDLRGDVLAELGGALMAAGELGRTEAVLTSAIEEATDAGDEHAEAQARLPLLALRLQVDVDADEESSLVEARRLIDIFERYDDSRGLANVWRELGKLLTWIGRSDESLEALDRAATYAAEAGEPVARIVGWIPWGLVAGPTWVPDALERCREIELGDAGGGSLLVGSMLLAALGEFDQARAEVASGRASLLERGQQLTWAGTSMVSGVVELYAGDVVAAEHVLREGYEVLLEMGETGFLSTVVGYLAEALLLQDRLDEALELSRVAEGTSGRFDLQSRVLWRNTRARVLARQAAVEEAEALAREGVALIAATDWLGHRADSLVALADVLRIAARAEEARASLEAALALREQKGDIVAAGRLRRAMAELG